MPFVPISALKEKALNWAVAQSLPQFVRIDERGILRGSNGQVVDYMVNWALPDLMERHQLSVMRAGGGWHAQRAGQPAVYGENPIEAALRAFVFYRVRAESDMSAHDVVIEVPAALVRDGDRKAPSAERMESGAIAPTM